MPILCLYATIDSEAKEPAWMSCSDHTARFDGIDSVCNLGMHFHE